MATLSHAESRRLYSWWWDSHISPKNSRWLKENLTDMDVKVKAMIKLIEEDADSFRKRAEMYYRKRPELMKLVEEFYRAYRALAERYDHATGALRQAHKTMAEAFPDQIPLLLNDDAPPGMFNDMQKDDFDGYKGNGVLPRENDTKYGEEKMHKESNLQNGDELQQEVRKLLEENEILRNKITNESERADKAEAEFKSLKGAILKLESEKEVMSLQYQISLEKISILEADISRIQENFKKINDDMKIGMNKLKSVVDQCHQLEKDKQTLEFDLGMLKEKAKKQQEELDLKEEELEKLNISINEEHGKSIQAENLQSQSQEEVKVLTLEIKNMETIKVGLEEEIQRLKEGIASLNEQIRASDLKIKSLQDEISLLKESKKKLEDEVGIHVEQKKALQQDKHNLEQRHQELTDKISAVNINVASLQAMVQELRDGNEELKEICGKHENERSLHLENLKYVEKITEKNSMLENSLSHANAELEELREKIKALEESCETLRKKVSMHLSEKAVLVSQVEAIAKNMENLMEGNTSLENSLGDANVKLDSLRGKLNSLEESCKSLNDQNSSLLAEKSNLVTQVESIGYSLSSLEIRYSELECNNMNLEKERDHVLDQVKDLQQSLRKEKEKHTAFVEFSTNQLAALENQILILQERIWFNEVELEGENYKIINAQTEIFILQRILRDMKENNTLLSDKCQRFFETCQWQEELISELKHETEMMKTSILDGQDEKHHLILEKSVILAFSEREFKTRLEELLSLQSEKHLFLEDNERLRQNVQTCNHKEEELKLEIATLCKNISNLQDIHSSLQSYVSELMEENVCFSKKINYMSKENGTLEDNNIALIEEIMKLEHLYLIYKSCLVEKINELRLLSNNMDHLCGTNSSLKREIRSLNERIGALEIESINLNESLLNSENEVIATKSLLLQKDTELLQLNHRFDEVDKKNLALMEYSTHIDKMVANGHQTNDALKEQYGKLYEEAEKLKMKEIDLISECEDRIQEVKCCEVEIETLLNELHCTTIKAATFEEKMLELAIEKQMIYEEITRRNAYEDSLKEKLGAMNGENKGLKEEISAYLPLVISLSDFINSLERHILLLANPHDLRSQDKKKKSNELGDGFHRSTSAFGILELEKLLAKVNALEGVVKDLQSHQEPEKFVSKTSLHAPIEEDKTLASKEEPIGKDIILHLKKKEAASISEQISEQAIKDIQLDHILSSSNEANDHTLELWETTEYKNLEAEKELTVDKLELTKNNSESSSKEHSNNLSERLSSDAQKLSELQKSANELKSTMDLYERDNTLSNIQYKKIKAQLKETESVISHLIDANNRLIKKAGKLSSSSELDEMGNTSERKIYDRARRGSEKIGRLELELQKLEYIWLKLKEEHDYKRARAAERRTKVMLRDYLYGRRESPKKKKVHCCACIRPRTKDDGSS